MERIPKPEEKIWNCRKNSASSWLWGDRGNFLQLGLPLEIIDFWLEKRFQISILFRLCVRASGLSEVPRFALQRVFNGFSGTLLGIRPTALNIIEHSINQHVRQKSNHRRQSCPRFGHGFLRGADCTAFLAHQQLDRASTYASEGLPLTSRSPPNDEPSP